MDGLQCIIDVSLNDESCTAAQLAHESLGIFFFPLLGLAHVTFPLFPSPTPVHAYLYRPPPLRCSTFVSITNTPHPSAKNLQSAGVTFDRMPRGCRYRIIFFKDSARLKDSELGTSRFSQLCHLLFSPHHFLSSNVIISSLRPPQAVGTFHFLRRPPGADWSMDLSSHREYQPRCRVLQGLVALPRLPIHA